MNLENLETKSVPHHSFTYEKKKTFSKFSPFLQVNKARNRSFISLLNHRVISLLFLKDKYNLQHSSNRDFFGRWGIYICILL
jgi:hypothetical protein